VYPPHLRTDVDAKMDEYEDMDVHANMGVRGDYLVESTDVQEADLGSHVDVEFQEYDLVITDTGNVGKGGRKKGSTVISK
jgi:hypothetical protein